ATFFLRSAVEVRRAVKVDENQAAAALHHAVRGHRRVEAAGDEGHDAAARADRQAAGAWNLLEAEEGAFRQNLDIDRHLGIFEIDARAGLLLDRRAENPVDLRRG